MFVSLTDDEQNPLTVVSLCAHLVNHPKQTSTEGYHRFPHEPQVDAYSPTERYINQSGDYIYNIQPKNVMCGRSPIHDLKVVDITSESIELLYPACDQHQLGMYDLVVVAKIKEDDQSDDISTITVDKQDVFELVEHSEEADESVSIDVSINAPLVVTSMNK